MLFYNTLPHTGDEFPVHVHIHATRLGSFYVIHNPATVLLCVHGRHGQDLTPLLPPQLSANNTVDARTDRVASLVDQDAGVVVESDDAAVGARGLLLGADDNGVAHVTALDLVRGRRAGHTTITSAAVLLDDDNYPVTNAGEFLLADNHRALDHCGARVVDAL